VAETVVLEAGKGVEKVGDSEKMVDCEVAEEVEPGVV
jgi:hypothetical protein